MRSVTFLTLLFDAVVLFNAPQIFAADSSKPRFTKTTEIKFLPAEQASEHHPVLLEGTVTCVPEGWKGFFLSDENGGVYCEAKDIESEKSFWPVRVGEKLTLSGVTKEGSINSFVQVHEVLKRSPGDLPLPKSFSISEINETQRTQDANFVQLRGVMVRMINIANEMEYGLTSHGVECDVSHSGFRIDPKQYSYAEVEVSGVVIPHLDRETFQLIVPNSSCFRILATREELVAKTPVNPLKSVLEDEPQNDYGLVRFQAEIFGANRDRSWLVDESTGVESIGSLSVDNAHQRLGIIGIRHSMAHRKWIEYAEVVDFLPPEKQSLPAKANLSSAEDYSVNQLVTWQGALVDRVSMDGREIQTFESAKGTRFSTRILDGSVSAATLNFGATYSISGLVTCPTGLLQDRILVARNFEDVHFESPPPLSNKARFLITLAFSCVLAVGLFASSLYLTLLKNSKFKLEQARDQLRIANDTLEKKVELRTEELKHANEVLTSEAQIRMLAQQETLDFKERLEDAISLAELGSIYWDFVTQTSNWSEQAFRLHGFNSASKSPSRTKYLEAILEEDRLAFQEYLNQVASSFERLQLRYRILAIDGSLRWLHAISRAVRNDLGSVLGVESVIQEITELVTTEERLRRAAKMEAVGRLAAGLAHDLNNALTIIQNNCYWVQMREGPGSENSSHLTAIQTAAKQSANLTKQLITYSRQQIVRPVRLNLNRSIQDFELLARQLLGDGFRVSYSLNENLQDAELDPNQFEQILMNLLINARDAMNDVGTIDIETSMTEIQHLDSKTHWALAPEPGCYVTLTIRDSGSGISPETLDKIFEPYFTTKPIDRGTGLGLAVVHGIVKQHGGGIGIQSNPADGTTFRIYFPIIQSAEDKPLSQQPAISSPAKHDGNQSILLVDDEAMVLTSTKLLLESRGYTVTGVNSALAALQELERSVFDLLLTDISMPDMPGFLLAKRVSEIRPNIPIVFMSGFLNEEAFRGELNGLQTRFIQKPFSISSLCSVIRETCA